MDDEKKVATTDLKLDESGSHPRPGPVGRIVRLGLGSLCLWYVHGLFQVFGNLIAADGSVRDVIWNGIIFGLFLVSYVVNIGFSRAWKKRPAFRPKNIIALSGRCTQSIRGKQGD